jgi:2-polyprenyl-6-methoxyphenol hydroxylase-like FAD-dependent oxidoreductase
MPVVGFLSIASVHVDRIRGESVTPWGVEEAQKLELLEILLMAGGHFASRLVLYGEGVSPKAARATALNLATLVLNVPGSLKIGHPRMCQALNDAAVAAGVTLLRGIENLKVTPGNPPKVSFVREGQLCELTPRLVIGADGADRRLRVRLVPMFKLIRCTISSAACWLRELPHGPWTNTRSVRKDLARSISFRRGIAACGYISGMRLISDVASSGRMACAIS